MRGEIVGPRQALDRTPGFRIGKSRQLRGDSRAERQIGTPGPELESGLIPTVTLAELFASQGHSEQAQEVYRQLLARAPGDARLQARLADLEVPGTVAETEVKGRAGTAAEDAIALLKELLETIRKERRDVLR